MSGRGARFLVQHVAAFNKLRLFALEKAKTRSKLRFLQVAAEVLERLLHAAGQPDASFEICAVVSQPGRPKGRGNKRVPQPSEVEQLAVSSGFSSERILCPEKASEKQFLETLKELSPDLCITAAYGNYLPTKFLAIPRFGTLNIHPSLLPKYRGAAPVQRTLQVCACCCSAAIRLARFLD